MGRFGGRGRTRRRGGAARGGPDERGFTLVELMVAVACMAVLAAVAAPRLGGWVLEARLNNARPLLAEVAARQRMHRVETGRYCCAGYTTTSEDALATPLGLGPALAEAGDFCVVFVCRDPALCESTASAPAFVSPSTTGTPEFEVWALLRRTAGVTAVAGPGGASCTPATGKAAPTGWVRPATPANVPGRAGQAVVLRHPPPPNGLQATDGTHRAIRFDWRDGFSLSDAQRP